MVIMILIRSSLINFGTTNQNTACKKKGNVVKRGLTTSSKQEKTACYWIYINYFYWLISVYSIKKVTRHGRRQMCL